MKIKFVWGSLHDAIWGGISGILGAICVSFVMEISGYAKLWFFFTFQLIFGFTIMFRFKKYWDKIWKK